jgi:chemotaxis methyl-accepting protein methylase
LERRHLHGEEPYTISLILETTFHRVRGWSWNILGTAFPRACGQGRGGHLHQGQDQSRRADWLIRYFDKGVGESDGFSA